MKRFLSILKKFTVFITDKIKKMALKVTNATPTSKGETTELYFHITEYYRNKDGYCMFPVVYFKNESKEDRVEIFYGDLKKKFEFQLEPEEIGVEKIETMAYNKIAEVLIECGKTVQSDVSGKWVQYITE